jgi:hypothetical protein
VEVRRVPHKTRSVTIENFNEQFKGIFDTHQVIWVGRSVPDTIAGYLTLILC